MLLRSASSPLLTSVTAATSSSSSPSADVHHLSFCSPINTATIKKAATTVNSNMLSRTLSDGNLSLLLLRRRRSLTTGAERDYSKNCRSTGYLVPTDENGCCDVAEDAIAATLVMGDGCAGGGGIRISKGRGGEPDSSDPHMNFEITYQRMIEADPSNSMVLGNYARFVKNVRGDVGRAKELCERAIVVNPLDAAVLCFYAEMIWEGTRDARRAEAYFDRAVKAAPEDCYVMASYAHFLWESEEQFQEEEEEEEEVADDRGRGKTRENLEKTDSFLWDSSSPAVAAAS